MKPEKYKQREMAIKVSVRTVPNGYILSLDNREYMCFTVEQLLSEMILRLGVEKTEYLEVEMVDGILQSIVNWPTVGEAHEANARLMAEAKEAHRDARIARSQIQDLTDSIDEKVEEIRNLENQKLLAVVKMENAERKCQQYRNEIQELRRQLRLSSLDQVTSPPDTKHKPEKKRKSPSQVIKEVKSECRKNKKVKPKQKKQAPTKPKARLVAVVEYSPEVYDLLMTPLTIKDTGLSSKAIMILQIAGGKVNEKIGDIVTLHRKDVLAVRGCGSQSMSEIEDWLENHGLSLNMRVKSILNHKNPRNEQ